MRVESSGRKMIFSVRRQMVVILDFEILGLIELTFFYRGLG